MKNTRRHGENSGYLVILLLVVGLTAFSHSMKELTEIHRLTLDASRVIAQWSGDVTPVEIPQAPQIAVKIEKFESSCQTKQSAPSVELPRLNKTPEPPTTPSAVTPSRKQIRIERTTRPVADIAKLKKLHRIDIDADAFEVRVPSVQLPEAGESGSVELPEFTFRAKVRKPGAIKINPRDREILFEDAEP